jgi:hypothetical protein
MKYAVNTRFIFGGTFYVEAEDKAKAEEQVEKRCGLILGGNIHSSLSVEEVDWDFPIHPETIIGAIRRVFNDQAEKQEDEEIP